MTETSRSSTSRAERFEHESSHSPRPSLARVVSVVAKAARSRIRRATGMAIAGVVVFSARVSFADGALGGAERSPQSVAARVDHRPNYSVAVNPVFVPLGTLSAEYEMSVFRPMTTLGVSGWYEYRDVRARWVYLKALVYPWGVALRGFGLGATFGVIRAYRDPNEPTQLAEETAPTIGAMAQYNFVFGPNDLILVGVGLGVRTPLTLIAEDSPLHRVDGDGRVVTGLAF